MRLARSYIAAAALLAATPSFAQPADVAALFHEIATDGVLLREQTKNWFGDPGPHGVALDAFMSAVFADPAFAEYIDDLYDPGPDIDAWLADVVAPAGRRMASVVGWGVGSLSTEAQLTYVTFYSGLAAWVAEALPERCSVMRTTSPAEPELIALEGRYRATLSPDVVDAHLAVLYDALTAYLTDAPPVNVFAEAALDRGNTAIADAFAANPIAALVMGADPDTLPAIVFCQASAAMFDVIINLPEPERTYGLQVVAQGDFRL